MKRCALVLVTTVVLVAPAIAEEDPARTPWVVRVLVASTDDPCDGTTVVLHIDDRLDRSVEFPVRSSWINDFDWDPIPLSNGTHRLYAQLISCNGVKSTFATVEFAHSDQVREHDFYVGIQSEGSVLSLDYLEASTEWDGSEFFSIRRAGEGVHADLIVTNLSDREFRPCEYGYRGVREKFLVEDEWNDEWEGGRNWPEGLETLEPGASFTTEFSGVMVVRKYVPPRDGQRRVSRKVRPTAKRYVIEVAPRTDYFHTLTDPPWAPGGLPSCDYYHLELPAEETDPTFTIQETLEDTTPRNPE